MLDSNPRCLQLSVTLTSFSPVITGRRAPSRCLFLGVPCWYPGALPPAGLHQAPQIPGLPAACAGSYIACRTCSGAGRTNIESGITIGGRSDRLVSELCLAGASSIQQANEVLDGFIPRFNEKFAIMAEQDCPACRCLEQSVSFDQILCFKHRRKVSRDNTVKYKRHTPQLLPDGTRPTYTGVQVEVQDDLNGRLLVQYQGQTILSQKALPRPAQLRDAATASPESLESASGVDGTGVSWVPSLATLETGEVDRDLRSRKSKRQQHITPTARQRALWEDVQRAKNRGLSLRSIARELDIHRNTVRRYALAKSPPQRKQKAQPGSKSLRP